MTKWIYSICFLFCFNAFAQSPPQGQGLISKVIPITYAQPKQVQQALEPLLKPGETISVYNNSLIVNVSDETLKQIRSIVHQLDVPPQVLLVRIHQGRADWLNQSQDSVSYSTTGGQEQTDNQSVQVQNGSYAFVSTGTNYPVISEVGVGWNTGVGYQRMQADKGFMIQPLLQGSKVKIKIVRNYAQQNLVNQENQQDQKSETTTLIPLNKWVVLSQARGPQNQASSDSVSYGAGNSADITGTLYIRVELVKN